MSEESRFPRSGDRSGPAPRSGPASRSGGRSGPPLIALEPSGTRSWLADAIEAGGARLAPIADAEALVWAHPAEPQRLADALAAHDDLRWVQLPWAGVEPYREVLDHGRTWTCAKGVYADPVAEHALALLLAGLRGLAGYARAGRWTDEQVGLNLFDAGVTVIGGGGITEALLPLLEPFRAEITVVRRHPQPMPGAARVVGVRQLHDALPGALGVVLALALVPETVGLIGAAELGRMGRHAWLVNVARGAHVVTDDLVAALRAGTIGGAALDVTDPEPLPGDHPLWSLPNCLITPHLGNTREMAKPLLAARVTENVRRWATGEPLIGVVDPDLGY